MLKGNHTLTLCFISLKSWHGLLYYIYYNLFFLIIFQEQHTKRLFKMQINYVHCFLLFILKRSNLSRLTGMIFLSWVCVLYVGRVLKSPLTYFMSYVNIPIFKNTKILGHIYFTHFCGSRYFKRKYEWWERKGEWAGVL